MQGSHLCCEMLGQQSLPWRWTSPPVCLLVVWLSTYLSQLGRNKA